MRYCAVFVAIFAAALTAAPPISAQDVNAGASTQAAAVSDPAFDEAIEAAKIAMMADPEKALLQSERALKLAGQQSADEKLVSRATALWLKAESLIGLNRLDEAGEIASEAVAIAEQEVPNTKLHGDILRSRGAVRALSGNVQDALADYLSAHDIFRNAKVDRSQAIALQDIGQIYWEAGDYKRTLRYYDQAVEIYNDDPGFALSNHNNLGETYKMLERFAEAEQEYGKAKEAARKLGSPMLETRILSNLALVQVEQRKLDDAQGTAESALALTRNGEAADWRDFVYGVLARIAFERGNDRGAARYLDQTFAGADFSTTDLVYREFHDLGATVFERLGQSGKALSHLKAFQRLDGQARALVSSTSSQLMAAEFDFANQNLRISQLKQGQLERDIQIERQRTEFRTTVFTGFAIAVSVVLVLVLIAFFSIRRSRNEVRAANTELQSVNTDLEHALKAKTDFLAMTSHEIRTPLNGILGTSQVLLANRAIDKDSMGRVKLIHSAGETMKALVDDLLDVAKMESGEVSLDVAPTQIRPILTDAADLWRSKLQSKGLEFTLDIRDMPDWVETDGDRIRQIIFNLLSNAVKFTRHGAVTLAAEVDPETGELAISVKDTGIGIPVDDQGKVFEAFHQVDNATTREFSGTGLGLSICNSLAVALGGHMEVESAVDRGSTFRLVLPVKALDSADTQSEAAPTTLDECRVGLIEANAMKQAILVGLIEPHVKSVAPFSNAEDCESALASGLLDHVILDAGSAAGENDPIVRLRELLERANEAQTPTTVLYAPNNELPLEAVSQLAHSQLLLKPVAGETLIACLQEHYSKLSDNAEDMTYASAA